MHLGIQMRIALQSGCFKFGCMWYM